MSALATHPPVQSNRTPARLRHRPALDGLRGLAVTAVMAYHVVPKQLTGGWLGVDIFLVLSGFLIASMLLRQRARDGRVDYRGFLIRRARRLLPGLFLMLVAVVIATRFLVPSGRHRAVGFDVVSAALQVSNWRFLLGDESYFGGISLPSPVRHMWSLSAQEQFYVIFPLVLAFLAAQQWKRRGVLLLFGGLAGLSLWRMIALYVPGTDPSRVYYGTDTRLFELLIGVIAAIVLWRRSFHPDGVRTRRGYRLERVVGVAGLLSLGVILVMMFTVSESSAPLFQGGLFGVAMLAVVVIAAASSPRRNALQTFLTNRPMRWLGERSYSLYIWHWPIIVMVSLAAPSMTELTRQLLSVFLTVVVSAASYRYVEQPIRVKGLRRWWRGRPRVGLLLGAVAMPAILGGAAWLIFSGADVAIPRSENVQLVAAPYTPGEPARVVLLGNSVAGGLAQYAKASSQTPDLSARPVASFGCDPFDRPVSSTEKTNVDTVACRFWRVNWPQAVERIKPQVVLYLATSSLLSEYVVDGQPVLPGDPRHDQVVASILGELKRVSTDGTPTKFVVANLACHERATLGGTSFAQRSNDIEMVKSLNRAIDAWAKQSGATVINLYSALCPGDRYHRGVNGVELYSDSLHYSDRSAPEVWRWLAPQLRALANP